MTKPEAKGHAFVAYDPRGGSCLHCGMRPEHPNHNGHLPRGLEKAPRFQPGPNAEQIRKQATKVIVGRVPMQVRRELNAAVKAGYLGHLKKDGLKPEIYFDPAHRNGAIERQAREAAYAVSCIAKVIASPADVREGIERSGGDVLAHTLNERVGKK